MHSFGVCGAVLGGFFRWTLVSEQWLVGSGYLAVVSEQCTVGSLS